MHKPLQLPGLTIHRLDEMTAAFTPALEFFPTLTPSMLEQSRPWLAPSGLDADDNIVLCIQSYLIRTPHHTILVDTCIGNDKHFPSRSLWHQKTDTRFMDGLAAAGVGVDDIDFVMCTHLHADHVGWNTPLDSRRWVPTFPNARYLFSAAEYAHWQAQPDRTPVTAIEDSVLPIVAAGRADLVRSDHELNDHVRLLPTPGHTVDHFAVELGHKAATAVLTGDLIHCPLQARHTELSMRLDHDPAQSAVTRRRFLEHYCDSGTHVCFAHFPSPSIGHVRRWGEGFRCDYAA